MQISPDSRGTLIVRPQGGAVQDPLAIPRRIQVIDGTFALVAKGFGELQEPLPIGIYRIQVESQSAPFETTLLVRPDVETVVEYPPTPSEKLPSAVPVPGSQGMHETVFHPFLAAWENLCRQADPNQADLLLVFTAETPGQTFDLSRICLRDDQGRLLAQITDLARIDPACQCATAHLQLKPGSSMLEWPHDREPDSCHRQPLWVPQGWCTVIFLGVQPETGRLNADKLSIYHWNPHRQTRHWLGQQVFPEAGEDVHRLTRSIQATELAQQSLLTRRQLVSFQQEEQMLMEKYDNPMLGILGCHMLLQRQQIDPKLIQEVLTNLHRLVPQHPDVTALQVMAQRAGVPLPQEIPLLTPLSAPPMFRAGCAALITEDWDSQASLITPGSFLDTIRAHVPSNGLWTRWQGKSTSPCAPPLQPGQAHLDLTPLPHGVLLSPGKVLVSSSPQKYRQPNFSSSLSHSPLVSKVLTYLQKLEEAQPDIRQHQDQLLDHLRWTGLNRHQISDLLGNIGIVPAIHLDDIQVETGDLFRIDPVTGQIQLRSESHFGSLIDPVGPVIAEDPATTATPEPEDPPHKHPFFRREDPPSMGSAEM